VPFFQYKVRVKVHPDKHLKEEEEERNRKRLRKKQKENKKYRQRRHRQRRRRMREKRRIRRRERSWQERKMPLPMKGRVAGSKRAETEPWPCINVEENASTPVPSSGQVGALVKRPVATKVLFWVNHITVPFTHCPPSLPYSLLLSIPVYFPSFLFFSTSRSQRQMLEVVALLRSRPFNCAMRATQSWIETLIPILVQVGDNVHWKMFEEKYRGQRNLTALCANFASADFVEIRKWKNNVPKKAVVHLLQSSLRYVALIGK